MNNQRLATLRAKKGYHILPVKTGQMLEIHEKVGQGSNERIWKFRGLVIKVKKPNHVDGTFLMRGKVAGHTVEKIYPLSFGKFEKVLLVDTYRTRRAKLYYIRDKVGKDAKMKSMATAEEKGVDLLALAVAEATAFAAPYAKAEETTEAAAEETTEAAAEETTEAAAEETTEAVAEETTESDDLTKIEGIGPKINDLLHEAGITTYAALAGSDAGTIKGILEAAEGNFASHDPSTRPDQSKMAADGKWDELKTRQDELDGGKA